MLFIYKNDDSNKDRTSETDSHQLQRQKTTGQTAQGNADVW